MRSGKFFGKARGPADHEAQELLQQVDDLRATERSADIEPPALLDQAVRNMARRELQQPPPPIGSKLRWLAGLSTVSVALIALGISLVQSPQAPAPASMPAKAKTIELERRREDTSPLRPAVRAPLPPEQAEAAAAANTSSVASERAAPAYSLADQADRTDSDELDQAALAKAQAGKASLAESPSADSLSAEAWLGLAQQLRDQGLHLEAREQLQALVDEYPEFPLPPWATQLLEAAQ
jgi:hypothetical protein